jgi:hypothetical protein
VEILLENTRFNVAITDEKTGVITDGKGLPQE